MECYKCVRLECPKIQEMFACIYNRVFTYRYVKKWWIRNIKYVKYDTLNILNFTGLFHSHLPLLQLGNSVHSVLAVLYHLREEKSKSAKIYLSIESNFNLKTFYRLVWFFWSFFQFYRLQSVPSLSDKKVIFTGFSGIGYRFHYLL